MKNNISKNLVPFLKRVEGVSKTAYKDSAGLYTIGVGHLIKHGEEHLIKETLTDEQIEALLRNDLDDVIEAVNAGIVPELSQNQFDALVSFTFNVGIGAFNHSTLRRTINGELGDAAVAAQIARWNKAGDHVVEGLTNRRNAEIALYVKGDYGDSTETKVAPKTTKTKK